METQLTDYEKALKLIAENDEIQTEKAVSIINEAINKIGEMGYKIEAHGEFKGNRINTQLVILKK